MRVGRWYSHCGVYCCTVSRIYMCGCGDWNQACGRLFDSTAMDALLKIQYAFQCKYNVWDGMCICVICVHSDFSFTFRAPHWSCWLLNQNLFCMKMDDDKFSVDQRSVVVASQWQNRKVLALSPYQDIPLKRLMLQRSLYLSQTELRQWLDPSKPNDEYEYLVLSLLSFGM